MKFCAPSPVDSQLQIVRPLLEFPKRVLLDYARANHLEFRDDASNATLDPLRNRIRLELIPLLKRRYQPAIEPALLRAMNILTAEGEYIGDEAQRWLHAASPPEFDRLPVAVQRRVLLKELQHLELPADFETVEVLRLRPDQPVNLAPNLSVSRAPEGLLRVNWHQPLKFAPERQTIETTERTGQTQFGGVNFRWRRIDTGGRIPRRTPGRETFDATAVGPRILLRRWRAGDRFQPIGLSQAAKLQDLFTNAKIPAALRRELVVAENAAGHIFWVEGLRIGELAKIKATTEVQMAWNWQRRAPKRTLQAPGHRASVAHLTNHGRRQSK